MDEFITVSNDGSIITGTNYWNTNYNRQGALYLSVNAGAFRLLVPDGIMVETDEMLTAKTVIISLGPGFGRHQIFEILFDDHSDNPYVLHFGTEQTDRIPGAESNGKTCRFIVYKRNLQVVMDTHCFFRLVSKIPCMKPWKEQYGSSSGL